MVNVVTKFESSLSQNLGEENRNFIKNGDFINWSKGDLIEGKGNTEYFADDWFGRRENCAKNIIATKIPLAKDNALRISRTEKDTNTHGFAVAQIIDLRNLPQLVGKTVLFSARVRAGSDYSSENSSLKLIINASSAENKPTSNPFSLGKNSQRIAYLPIKLKQEWNNPILSAKIPEGTTFIMVRAITEKMSEVSATKDDFFEIGNVELKIDYEGIDLENKPQSEKIPIFHLASMARSGETVFLRCLNAHPKIYNLVNINLDEEDENQQLYVYLQDCEHTNISKNHCLVERLNLEDEKLILVKQGTWEHKYPFNGVVLARNPISIYGSLIAHGLKSTATADEIAKKKANSANSNYFIRWMRDIDDYLVNSFKDLDYLEQFCAFYNRRMYPLSQLGLPIVHYEAFCENTEQYLNLVQKHFSLESDESVLNSHSQYSNNDRGHGLINLSQPVNSKSLDKWKKFVSLAEFNRIASLTYNTWQAFGYILTPNNISVKESHKWINNI